MRTMMEMMAMHDDKNGDVELMDENKDDNYKNVMIAVMVLMAKVVIMAIVVAMKKCGDDEIDVL